MSKIAVFATNEDQRRMKLKPKSLFVMVNSYNDIRGSEFEGTITLPGWHHDADKVEAYEILIQRNPKLRP